MAWAGSLPESRVSRKYTGTVPAADPGEDKPPHSDGHRPTRHHLDLGVETLEMVAELPADSMLDLAARGVDPLAKESLVVHEGDPEGRDRQVRGGPEEVPGQHAQTTAEGGYLVADGDLHGEVRDGHRLSLPYQRAVKFLEVRPLEP